MNPHLLGSSPLPQLLVIFAVFILIYGTTRLRKK
jgi:Sec-independent protein translocase protein TatA